MPSKPEPKDLQEERTLEGMRIVRIGRGHYRCHSSSRPEVAYDVDIIHYDGLGSCTCDDYVCRRKPRWRDVRKPYDCFRCKHLRRVRNHVLDQIVQHFQTPEAKPETKPETKPMTKPTTQPYQQRVIDEKHELDTKLSSLRAFALTATFGAIPNDEQNRIHRQYAVMTTYSQILGERIDAFNHQPV